MTQRRETPRAAAPPTWEDVSRSYLDAHLDRLRLYLERRILWLRDRWAGDPGPPYQGMVIGDAEVDRALAGGEPEAERRFSEEEPRAASIADRIREAERALATAEDTDPEDTPPALELLARIFGLSDIERDILLLAAAPSLDPAFERLYAYAQDTVQRPYATLALADSLFGVDGTRSSVRDALIPVATLRQLQLVTVEPGQAPATPPSLQPLVVDERVVDFLRGVNRLDVRIAQVVRPLPSSSPVPEQEETAWRIAQALQGGEGGWPILNLVGGEDVGKERITEAVCEELALRPVVLSWDRIPGVGPERERLLMLLQREAALSRLAFYLSDTRRETDSPPTDDPLGPIVDRLGAFLVVSSIEQIRTEREALVVRVTKPDSASQENLWSRTLSGLRHSLNGQTAEVVQQFDLGPIAILQSVEAARNLARLRDAPGEGTITSEDLWQACRDQAGMKVGQLARRIRPCYTWEDIVLPDDASQQLREIAAQVAHRPQVYEGWGFGAKLSRGRGISALFSGPSGTGKTMAAEILAEHLALDLYRIDLASVVSKYIGETEKNLKSVFDAAEQSGAILFFDEADALFGKRTEVKDSHDRYANIEVNYLLQRMEDYRGLAILSTNRKSALDRAFLRRLRFLVDFPFPDTSMRRLIWQRVFPPEAQLDAPDFAALSRLEISGGSIRNIALNGAFLAAAENSAIGMDHLMRAARREYMKIGKALSDLEAWTSRTGGSR